MYTCCLHERCIPYLHHDRVVRDQASRTIDVYTERIKSHAKSLPETVIPPPSAAAPGTAPLAKTAAATTEYSWGGWAISSFTNKLSAANGEINTANTAATTNGIASDSARSSSAPPGRDRHGLPVPSAAVPQTATASPLARHAVLSPALPTPAVSSTASPADEADFDAWGDMNDPWNDASAQQDSAFFEAVNSNHPVMQPARPGSGAESGIGSSGFDDGGEPDFAGWMAAQSQKKGVRTLPVGLGIPGPAGRTQRAAAVAGRVAVKRETGLRGAAKVTPALIPVPAAKEKSWEEDGWGDGWD